MADRWIQGATEKMKEKGTLGKFGKATPKKIAAAKREGGTREKEAVFAENMKKAARHKEIARQHERKAREHRRHASELGGK